MPDDLKNYDPNNVRVTTGSNARTFGDEPKYPTPQPRDPDMHAVRRWEAAQQELATNPLGLTAQNRDVLRRGWGDDEFKRRFRHAMEATGAVNTKVRFR